MKRILQILGFLFVLLTLSTFLVYQTVAERERQLSDAYNKPRDGLFPTDFETPEKLAQVRADLKVFAIMLQLLAAAAAICWLLFVALCLAERHRRLAMLKRRNELASATTFGQDQPAETERSWKHILQILGSLFLMCLICLLVFQAQLMNERQSLDGVFFVQFGQVQKYTERIDTLDAVLRVFAFSIQILIAANLICWVGAAALWLAERDRRIALVASPQENPVAPATTAVGQTAVEAQ